MIDYFLEHGIKAAVVCGVACVVAMTAVWLLFGVFNLNLTGEFPSVDDKKWQAVFLENGQVYFGKLAEYDQNYVTLSDVYYLKTAADLEKDSANLNLIKLGGELHGPEDEIFITKDSVLFWENMKNTSRVVQSIEQSR